MPVGHILQLVPPRHMAFEYTPTAYFEISDLPFGEDACDMYVLSGVRFRDQAVVTNHPAGSFHAFLASHPSASCEPRAANKADHKRCRLSPAQRQQILDEFPTFTAQDLATACGVSSATSGRGAARGSTAECSGVDDPDADSDPDAADTSNRDEEAVLKELGEIRDALDEANAEEDDTSFYIHIQGGMQTATSKSVVADAAVCLRRAFVETWCSKYQFPRHSAFYFSLYGQEDARVMAREVARRGTHFFNIYLEAGDDSFRYSPGDIVSYEEPLDWVHWMSSRDVSSHCFRRASGIRRLVPKNPSKRA